MSEPKQQKQEEGWQAEKAWSQRVYHYIVGTFSLCGRLGFYTGELMPHKGKKGAEDCAECFRRVEKRLAKVTAG
jgi:hypothetical protein